MLTQTSRDDSKKISARNGKSCTTGPTSNHNTSISPDSSGPITPKKRSSPNSNYLRSSNPHSSARARTALNDDHDRNEHPRTWDSVGHTSSNVNNHCAHSRATDHSSSDSSSGTISKGFA